MVNNNRKNVERKVKELSKLHWVTVLKNGDTILLNPIYKLIIKTYRDASFLTKQQLFIYYF